MPIKKSDFKKEHQFKSSQTASECYPSHRIFNIVALPQTRLHHPIFCISLFQDNIDLKEKVELRDLLHSVLQKCFFSCLSKIKFNTHYQKKSRSIFFSPCLKNFRISVQDFKLSSVGLRKEILKSSTTGVVYTQLRFEYEVITFRVRL